MRPSICFMTGNIEIRLLSGLQFCITGQGEGKSSAGIATVTGDDPACV